MRYLDTSFLTPLFKTEATSAGVEHFIYGLPKGAATISDWTRVEFSSLLAKEVRMGGLSSSEANAIDQRFEAQIRVGFTVLGVTVADFDLAKRYLGDHSSGLRAGDAMNLAIASHNGASAIYSFDKMLVKAGRSLGLSMNTGFGQAP